MALATPICGELQQREAPFIEHCWLGPQVFTTKVLSSLSPAVPHTLSCSALGLVSQVVFQAQLLDLRPLLLRPIDMALLHLNGTSKQQRRSEPLVRADVQSETQVFEGPLAQRCAARNHEFSRVVM